MPGVRACYRARVKIYVVMPRGCEAARVRQPLKTHAVPEYHFRTPQEAWAQHVAWRAMLRRDPPDPADHVIVAAHSTGGRSEHGADEFVEDWSDAVDPQGLPAVVDEERARVAATLVA